ncbi:tRNA (adenosine(37)-N6)-dimethylallyltransferase MiaA [Candidatus Gracilibacteria bacterium]|nr:tRNA (adenosine(37)-N6)-dimethylallyltransferase MiaA [Candidatus Gracilibacteria bacterium]
MLQKYKQAIDEYLSSEVLLPKIIVIYGPTACGKTALSLDIAEYLGSDIISTDSRQIYRDMDIGTGKIKPSEMRGIRHHMINVIDPSQIWSVVDYIDMALPIIEQIHSEGKIPILCGGTGLYIDGLLYEMGYPDTPPDWKYRDELEDIRLSKGNQELWNMLATIDPEYAHTLEVGNYRYVMRGLEVIRQTGISKLTSIGKKTARFAPLYITPYDDANRKELYANIDRRVSEMFDNGLIGEIEYIVSQFSSHCPGLTTIGYREVVDALKGNTTLEQAKSLIQQRSRNYAKRQITWNRKYEYGNTSRQSSRFEK